MRCEFLLQDCNTFVDLQALKPHHLHLPTLKEVVGEIILGFGRQFRVGKLARIPLPANSWACKKRARPKTWGKYRGICCEKLVLGKTRPGCCKPGCLQFSRGRALLDSFAPFCALFALFCALFALFCELALAPFALIRALLRSCACFCVQPRLERPRLGTVSTLEFKNLEREKGT